MQFGGRAGIFANVVQYTDKGSAPDDRGDRPPYRVKSTALFALVLRNVFYRLHFMRFAVTLGAFLAIPSFAAAQRGMPDANPMRPGDRVLVRVWIDSSFADTARIDTKGMLVLPVLGGLLVHGLGPADMADSIRRAYDRILRRPAVEATPLRRVVVSGEVRRPGIYFLEPQSTIREAVAVAGGISDIGRVRALQVSRDSVLVAIPDWDRRPDARIESGDVIWVDRESWLRRNALTVVSGLSVLLSLVITLAR